MRIPHTPPMLTPLLDLLIIVIFTQLISANRDTQRAQHDRAIADSTRISSDAARAEANAELERLDRIIQIQNRNYDSLTTITSELQTQLEMQREVAEHMQQQLEAIGSMFRSQFDVPDDVIDEILTGIDEGDIREVESLLEEIQTASPTEVIRIARRMNEMLKKVDFWDIYVDEDNRIFFSAADQIFINGFTPSSPEAVRNRLHQEMTNMPDQARIVIILVSLHSETSIDTKNLLIPVLQDLSLTLRGSGALNSDIILADWVISNERP